MVEELLAVLAPGGMIRPQVVAIRGSNKVGRPGTPDSLFIVLCWRYPLFSPDGVG
jgi:hypothetical protein